MLISDKEFLTFDDVLIKPQYSDIPSRMMVDLSTSIGPLDLHNPIISANMDTITGPSMFDAMVKAGGYGFLHRFETFETRLKWAKLGYPVTIGVSDNELILAENAMDVGAYVFCVDIAHGDSERVAIVINHLRRCEHKVRFVIVAGNVVTESGAYKLIDAGADVIKVGVGPGSVCTTRSVTGHGIPQLTAIMDVSLVCRNLGVGLIADGGIRTSGDIVKALAAGADAVMIGGLFAGCTETPGENIVTPSGNFKVYRGMASKEAYADNPNRKSKHPTAEGINTMVPSNGPAQEVVNRLVGGIQSGLTYSGVTNIAALRERAQFIRVTSTTLIESGTRL